MIDLYMMIPDTLIPTNSCHTRRHVATVGLSEYQVPWSECRSSSHD